MKCENFERLFLYLRHPSYGEIAEHKRLEHEPKLEEMRTHAFVLFPNNAKERRIQSYVRKKGEWDGNGNPGTWFFRRAPMELTVRDAVRKSKWYTAYEKK